MVLRTQSVRATLAEREGLNQCIRNGGLLIHMCKSQRNTYLSPPPFFFDKNYKSSIEQKQI